MAAEVQDFLDRSGETARQLPEYWGTWFVQVEGSEMKETNLAIFYHLGASVVALKNLRTGMSMAEAVMQATKAAGWLVNCRLQMEDVFSEHLRDEANGLSQLLLRMFRDFNASDQAGTLSEDLNWVIQESVKSFENTFVHDCRHMDIFAVTPKGDLSTRILIDDAAKKFPKDLLRVIPNDVICDIQEAGRCLAFERATACAFHICRATEAFMLAYYVKLAKQPWPPPPMRKEWAVIVDQLAAKGAPRQIINRLKELREDRNSYAHPDVTVPLDEAPIVYDICTGSMFYMAKEMV